MCFANADGTQAKKSRRSPAQSPPPLDPKNKFNFKSPVFSSPKHTNLANGRRLLLKTATG
jgi:hypothetical protein